MGSSPAPHGLSHLVRDRVFWLSALIVGVALFPYVVPILDADQFWYWRWSYFDVPVGVGAVLGVSVGIGKIRPPAERRFWQLVAVAYGAALFVEIGQSMVPDGLWSRRMQLAVESCYWVFYLALFLAVDVSRGEPEEEGARRLRRVGSAALGTFLAGLITYFDTVSSSAASWGVGDGLLLFALMDGVLCLAFLWARNATEDRRWRRILGGMAVVHTLWAVVDTAEAMLYLEPFASMEFAPATDLLWMTPAIALLVVGRWHLATPHELSNSPRRADTSGPQGGVIVAGLLFLPLIHALFYGFGFLNPSLREIRESIVYVYLTVMGLMTFISLRTLERGRAQSMEELRIVAARREGDLERFRELLADVGHEIRTPISVLMSDVDLSLMKSRTTDEYQSVLGRVRAEIVRVVQLTENLLSLAAGSTGAFELDPVDIDVGQLLDAIVDAYELSATEKGIGLDVEAEPGLVLFGDARLVDDAVSNLVDNAIKFSPPGGNIRIHARTTQARVQLTVADDGPGIANSDRTRVFQRFYRGGASGDPPPGSGLGLAIVKSAMERHGGQVWHTGSEEGGAKFTLSFPLPE